MPRNKTQQPAEGHLLDRLGRGAVKLAGDVKPLGVGVDAELDRGGEFSRMICVWAFITVRLRV